MAAKKRKAGAGVSRVKFVVFDKDGDESESFVVDSEAEAKRKAMLSADASDQSGGYGPYIVRRVEERWQDVERE